MLEINGTAHFDMISELSFRYDLGLSFRYDSIRFITDYFMINLGQNYRFEMTRLISI